MRQARRRRNVAILVGVVILAIVLTLFFMPTSKHDDKEFLDIGTHDLTQEIPNDNQVDKESIKEPVVGIVDIKQEEKEEEPIVEPKKELALCNDFIMKQGEELKIEGNTIRLVKIASTSVKLEVNGKLMILSEGEYERKDDLGLQIEDGKLVFFEDGNEDNQIQIRIGCTGGKTPNDKIVEDNLKESGLQICMEMKEVCYKNFEKPDKDSFENITEYEFCDDYTLEQGESITLGEFDIKVETISKDTALIDIDGDNVIIEPDEYRRVNDLGIKLTNLGFFDEDDPDNQVKLEIGCEGEGLSDSEYIDRNIWNKANSACNDLIKLCEEKFDVKIDD